MPKSLFSLLSNSERSFFRECEHFSDLLSIFKELEVSNNGVILTTHVSADPDGTGAIFGFFFLITRYFPNKKVYLCLDSVNQISLRLINSLQLEGVLKSNLINEQKKAELIHERQSYDLVVFDTHNYGNIQELDKLLQGKIERVLFIDHHLETEYSTQTPGEDHPFSSISEWKFVCNDFKASSEIILQIFYLLEDRIDPKFIKFLLLGILTDSKRLRLADSSLLKSITYWLGKIKETSLSSLFELLDNEYTRSERIARLKGAQRVIIKNISDYLIVFTNISSFEASAANALIQIGADISCAIAETKSEIRISLRGKLGILKDLNIHLGEIAGKIASSFPNSSGSGHQGASGINIKGSYSLLEIRKKIENIIILEIEKISD